MVLVDVFGIFFSNSDSVRRVCPRNSKFDPKSNCTPQEQKNVLDSSYSRGKVVPRWQKPHISLSLAKTTTRAADFFPTVLSAFFSLPQAFSRRGLAFSPERFEKKSREYKVLNTEPTDLMDFANHPYDGRPNDVGSVFLLGIQNSDCGSELTFVKVFMLG